MNIDSLRLEKTAAGFFIIITFFMTAIAGTPTTTNDYVKFSINVKEKSIKAGAQGTLQISLMPKKGIHINLVPPITIALDSEIIVTTVGKPSISKIDSFLNPQKPIEQSIHLPQKIKAGTIDIKGTITYFYCSDTEGWCSRFKQPFTATVSVRK